MTSPQIRVRIPARVLVFILPILLGDLVDCCQRTGRHLLMPGAQERSAQEIITSFKNDFDLNVYFGLRKIGISRETGSSNATKCYGNLGCLHLNDDWFGLNRPVNVLPLDRHVINTRFILTTRESSSLFYQPRFLNLSQPLSITTSPFRGTRPTKIIIHGFIDTGFVPWISEMTNLFLLNDDVNVIVIDWGGGASGLYSQSAANTRLVGLEVSALIDYLMEYKGARPEDFHIIGHSLGAHIAGYAGEKLKSWRKVKLGRITALDPAQPLFKGMPEFVRLDPGDAEFVDVIHTDAKSFLMGGYGLETPCGHIDFYPNGGFDQPGCSLFDMPVSLDSMVAPGSTAADTMGRHLVACSHNRGIELYIDSLRSVQTKCQLVAHRCDSYEDFVEGRCFDCGAAGENCAILGERAIEYKPFTNREPNGQKFYLKTAKKSPFCQHHYLLEFNLAQPKHAERWVQGFLKVNLYGTQSEITDVDLTPEESLKVTHGTSTGFVLAFSRQLGTVRLVNVEWNYDHEIDPLDPLKVCPVLLCSDAIYMKSLAIYSISPEIEAATLTTTRPAGRLPASTVSFPDVSVSVKKPHNQPKVERTVVCGDSEDGFSTIQSGSWKLFYKECS